MRLFIEQIQKLFQLREAAQICAKLREEVLSDFHSFVSSEEKQYKSHDLAFALLFLRRDERMKVSVHPAGDAAGRSFLGKEFDIACDIFRLTLKSI